MFDFVEYCEGGCCCEWVFVEGCVVLIGLEEFVCCVEGDECVDWKVVFDFFCYCDGVGCCVWW